MLMDTCPSLTEVATELEMHSNADGRKGYCHPGSKLGSHRTRSGAAVRKSLIAVLLLLISLIDILCMDAH